MCSFLSGFLKFCGAFAPLDLPPNPQGGTPEEELENKS